MTQFLSTAQEWNNATLSPETTVREVLRLISTDESDWEQFRGLFLASARFTVVNDVNEMGLRATTFALEDFVRIFLNSPDRKFTEYELKMDIDRYNGIASVWQTYEVDLNGMKNQGINAFHLVFHNDRWWICNIIWTNNTNGTEIPERYLPEE